MKTKPRIYLGIPSTGTRCDAQVYFLEQLKAKYAEHFELVYPSQCIHRTFHDFARNGFTEEFLDSDCDAIWFLDSDICPPVHVGDLIALHWDKWKAAGACYPIFMPAPGAAEASVLFTAYKGIAQEGNKKGIHLTEVPRGGTDWLDGLATGCMILKRECFDNLEKPYFEFKFDHDSRKMTEGEDLGFCLKLAKQGIKFFTDYSMVCKHYKTVCLLDINNYAVSFSNSKVLAYDQEVRGKIQSAVSAAETAGYNRGMANSVMQTPTKTKSGIVLPHGLL